MGFSLTMQRERDEMKNKNSASKELKMCLSFKSFRSNIHRNYCQLNSATKSDRTDSDDDVDSGCSVSVATIYV